MNAPVSAKSLGALALVAAAVCVSPTASAEEPPSATTPEPSDKTDPADKTEPKPAEPKQEAKAEPQPGPVAPPTERPESSTALPGWILLGTGVAGIATGTGLGISAGAKKSDLEASCAPDKSCPTSQRDELDSARTIANASTVFVVVGGIITIAGVLLLVTPKTPDPWRSTSKTRPFITPGGAGLTGTF